MRNTNKEMVVELVLGIALSLGMNVALHSAGLLRFTCVFGVRASTPEEAGHALCNRINDVLVVVRASMHDATTLVIDWYLPLSGGIAKKAVVRAFRRFVEITATIGRFDDDDLLE